MKFDPGIRDLLFVLRPRSVSLLSLSIWALPQELCWCKELSLFADMIMGSISEYAAHKSPAASAANKSSCW